MGELFPEEIILETRGDENPAKAQATTGHTLSQGMPDAPCEG